MSRSQSCVKQGSRIAQLMAFGIFVGALAVRPAVALEETDDEKDGRKACEAQICRLIVDKPKEKGALKCDLGKTWGKAKIKEGADSKQIKWSFGDARCKVSVRIPKRVIVKALTQPKFTFEARPHVVHCDVETGNGIEPVRAVLKPKLKFEGGRVKKAWVGLKELDGPTLLKGLVWTTAKLEDTLGIFHSEMVKEINKFVHKTCPADYGPESEKDKKKKGKDKKAKDTENDTKVVKKPDPDKSAEKPETSKADSHAKPSKEDGGKSEAEGKAASDATPKKD